MSQQSNGCLIHYTKETYGDSFGADLLEQYKMYVQSAENVSARRVASSRYLLTLNIALVTYTAFNLKVPYRAIGRRWFRYSASWSLGFGTRSFSPTET